MILIMSRLISSQATDALEGVGFRSVNYGCLVVNLETNDPLINLNSGLSTNLVLGLNSISEVTVNTLSYSVDQGRYGASQVNYVTKSGRRRPARRQRSMRKRSESS
jgi:hypothetical protein